MGFVVFLADVYSTGVRPSNSEEAGAAAGALLADRKKLRGRVNAAFDILLNWAQGERQVDLSRTAAIGFCFGGSAVLELARSGRDIGAVVSFHGGLATSLPAEAGSIQASILVLHGAKDPLVPAEDVAAFFAEMTAAEADWQFVSFGNAVHSFTDPTASWAGTAEYHEPSANLAFAFMREFLADRLAGE